MSGANVLIDLRDGARPRATTDRGARFATRRPRRSDVLLVLALVAVVVTAHQLNAAGWPGYFDDEGTYLSQAVAVRDGELAPYTYWYDHPPLGWIQLALLTWLPALFVEPEVAAGRMAMAVFSAGSAALVFGVARRLGVRRSFAAFATLLWGLSPLVLFESRQVFLDTVGTPWLLLAVFLALNPRRHLGVHMAAGAALGVAVLTKETLIVFAPAVFVAVWLGTDRRTRAFCVAAFGSAVVVLGSGYVLFAALKGELFPGPGHVSLLDALVFQTVSRRGSGFILAPGTGSFGLLNLWLGMDRVLIVGGVAAILPALLQRRLRTTGVAVLVPTLMALRPDGYLPYMYVTAVLPFAALAIAGTLDSGWRRLDGLAFRSLVRRGVPRATAGWVSSVTGVVLPAVLLAAVLPSWVPQLRTAWTAQLNTTHQPAVDWITTHADPQDRVVVDNNFWLDLHAAGWDDPWKNIWFTKLDLDPIAAAVDLPRGWRDVDYVIWSGAFDYLGDNDMPTIEAIRDNSRVVATFGDPDDPDRIEIRRVDGSDAAPVPAPGDGS